MKKLLILLTIVMAVPLAAAECTRNSVVVSCSELTGFFVGMAIFWFLFMVIGIAGTIFWILMLIDCIRYERNDKLVWVLVILLTNLLGALIYYFVVKRSRKARKSKK
ncbi:MAG TPA: PLD nuclease N-terminal domain-containing protein [Candidatus Nanoarchaeia archaeon]|nr:PLD nuclease N-terminal domain-containing protein [Candidatus Nanoarchaeia archaeon]